MATVFTPHILVLITIAAATAGLAAYAWQREEYGTRSFVWLMLVFTVYATTQAVGLLTPVEPTRLLLNRIQWIATAAVPLAWILFALEYTGWDEVLTPRVTVALAAVPVVTVVVVWTNSWHGLMWTHNSLNIVNGFAILDQVFGPWFWVYVAYSYGAILAGIALFARLVWVSDRLYLDQSALLLVGAVAPLLTSVLTVLDLSIVRDPTLDMTPYGFAVSGLAFGYAIFRRRLFDIVPATRQLGRRAAIHDLEDGVLIVDRDRRVIYCNPASATLLETPPDTMTGMSVRSVVDTGSIDFDADDAVAELERDGAIYEIRTSPIRDRRDDIVGHTLLISDITERRTRVRRLEQQREDLQRLEVLNSVLRGVNRVLVSATTREEIERDVCNHLAESELYRTAFITDLHTWSGRADQWTIAGEEIDPRMLPETVDNDAIGPTNRIEAAITVDGPDGKGERGSWAVVPLVHRRTVYGVLGLYSRRASLADESSREQEILAELGATVGHSINALEHRRLLIDETPIEVKLRSRDEHAPLLTVASETQCELEIKGVVPSGENGPIAYIEVTGAPDQVAAVLEDVSTGSVRPIRTDGGEGLLEWTVPGESLVGTVMGHNISTLRVTVEPKYLECLVEVASEDKVRAMLDELRNSFPDTRLEAKRQRELESPFERTGSLPEGVLDELTDRQREALEAAYRAGYFEWPRESSAEDIAETLDISRPTFQGHLRKAEDAVLAELFSSDGTE